MLISSHDFFSFWWGSWYSGSLMALLRLWGLQWTCPLFPPSSTCSKIPLKDKLLGSKNIDAGTVGNTGHCKDVNIYEYNFIQCNSHYIVKVAQLCLTLWDPMVYIVHEILQARILGWVAFPFSRGSSQPRDWIPVSCTAGRFLTPWAPVEALTLNSCH